MIQVSIASKQVPKFRGPFYEEFQGKEWKLSVQKDLTNVTAKTDGIKKEVPKEEEQKGFKKEDPKVKIDYSQFKKTELEKIGDYIADKKVKEETKMKNEVLVYKQKLLASAEKEKLERLDEISKEIEEFKKKKLEKMEEILKDELEDRRKQLDLDLIKSKDQMEELIKERDNLKDQNEKLTFENRNLKRENTEMKEKGSKMNEDEKKSQKLSNDLDQLKNESLKLNGEIIDLKEKNEENQFKIKEYERKLERSYLEKRELETKKNEEIQKLKDEIQSVSREDPEVIETLKNELSEQSRMIDTLKLEILDQKKVIDDLQLKVQELSQEKENPQVDLDKIRQDIQKDLEKDLQTKKKDIEDEKEKMRKEKEDLEKKLKEEEEKKMKEAQGFEKKRMIASKMSIFLGKKERSDSFVAGGNPELLQKIDNLEKKIKEENEIHEKQVLNLMSEIRRLNVSREQMMNLLYVAQEQQKNPNQTLIIDSPKLQRINTVNSLSGKKGLPPVPIKNSPSLSNIQKDDTKIFGKDIGEVMKRKNQEGFKIPKEILAIVNHLENKGLKDEGIFRVPGEVTFVNEMKEAMDKGNFVIKENDKNYAVLASLLKLYLRELPQPLLMYENYNTFLQLIENKESNFDKIKNLIQSIPLHYKNLLEVLLNLLNKVVENTEFNKMTISSLSIVFGMNLLKSKDETPLIMMRDCKKVNEVCSFLITNAKNLK